MLYILKRTIGIIFGAIFIAYSPVIVCIGAGLLHRVFPWGGYLLFFVSGVLFALVSALVFLWTVGDLFLRKELT